jgi:hypothetical protein
MPGDLHPYEDGGWVLMPQELPRRRSGRVGRGLTMLLFIFTLLLGQVSLVAFADDTPIASGTAADEPSASPAGPIDDSLDETGDDDAPDGDGTQDGAVAGGGDEIFENDDAPAEGSVSDDAAATETEVTASTATSDESTSTGDDVVAQVIAEDEPGPASGDGVQPLFVAGNPDCLDVMAEGDFLFEHKTGVPEDDTIELSFDGLSGTLVIEVDEENETFDFSFSGDFVAAGVIVKGGDNANFYDYRPGGNAADTDLHAPINPENDKFYGLSHISFCITEVERVPGIDVEKSCPESVQAGTEIDYTITVENTGNETLVVTVEDTLLGDITADFDVDLSTGLAVGATATAVVTYQPGPNEDPVTNTVTAEGTGDDSAAVDTDTASCETDVTEGEIAAIDVEKSCPETVEAGGLIEYTITVENTGTEALVDVTVDDTILGDITGEFDVELSAGLAVGATATAVVTYDPGPDEDPITNTVTAMGTGNVSDVTDTDTAICETDIVTVEGAAIQVIKTGPALAHRGDTVTYSFTVTNVGDVELFDVDLSDPRCDTGTIQAGAEVDAGLAVGEVWTFTCTHLVLQSDPDPLPNTATVRGDTQVGAGGEEVTDQDSHTVNLIRPAIQIVKTVSDGTVPVGTLVTYTYVVTNLGDTTLFDVSVDDDVIGHIDVVPSLAAGASVTLSASFTVGTTPVTNVGTAGGSDALGEFVSDTDTAFVTPIAGGGQGPGQGPGGVVGGVGGSISGAGGETPFTGWEVWRWMLAAAGLVLIGALALIGTRRSRGTA